MNAPALLFDVDGTLADTDTLHLHAWNRYLAPRGVSFTRAEYDARVHGRSNLLLLRDLVPGIADAEALRMGTEKEAVFRSLATALAAPPGLLAVLDWADAAGIACGVVTNGPRANCDHILAALAIEGRFCHRVCGEDAEQPKPDPMPYRMAMRALGAAPARTIVFEDSPAGIRSAVAAGTTVVALTTSLDAPAALALGARIAVADFADPALPPLLAALRDAA